MSVFPKSCSSAATHSSVHTPFFHTRRARAQTVMMGLVVRSAPRCWVNCGRVPGLVAGPLRVAGVWANASCRQRMSAERESCGTFSALNSKHKRVCKDARRDNGEHDGVPSARSFASSSSGLRSGAGLLVSSTADASPSTGMLRRKNRFDGAAVMMMKRLQRRGFNLRPLPRAGSARW